MKIDFSNVDKDIFSMQDYADNILKEVTAELMKGACGSPAAYHLFEVNRDCKKLDATMVILYHHIVAQLLYLGKRTRPNLLLVILFLYTRVQEPDEDN